MIGLATFLLLLAPQATAPSPGPGPQSPLFGGVPTGTATPSPLPLSLADAIDRGLRGNLALVLAEQGVRAARGGRLEAFGDVLPHLNGRLSAVRQKLSLEAFGFSGFPGIDSPVVGPFNVFDSRVLLTEELDLKGLYKARAEGQRVEAARWTYQDTRELVVLVSGNLYLRTLAEQSRVEAARAEAETARALHQLALDRKSAGVVPGVDVLRAEVELRSREQRVIEADTRLARAKLDLARAIGLPLGQEIQLTDAMPSPVVPPLTLEQTMEMAFARRSDWKAAQARVRAAEASRRSALGEALPGLTLDADYGAIGQTYGGARNTFTLAGALRVPLFQGGLVAGKVLAADAALQSARAGMEDLRGRIDYDVRVAGLELKAAADRQAVAESARALAREQLRQAQDRFAAGVANNVDVVLAQEAVARAEEDWISTVYDFNLARATLGRAVGLVEDAFRQLVRGQ
ncbi:MAG TPA: TolC family protein [Vicinamibacteria bacterium]|nr:TolC family protein [Vicinamibacteria bacterium]